MYTFTCCFFIKLFILNNPLDFLIRIYNKTIYLEIIMAYNFLIMEILINFDILEFYKN